MFDNWFSRSSFHDWLRTTAAWIPVEWHWYTIINPFCTLIHSHWHCWCTLMRCFTDALVNTGDTASTWCSHQRCTDALLVLDQLQQQAIHLSRIDTLTKLSPMYICTQMCRCTDAFWCLVQHWCTWCTDVGCTTDVLLHWTNIQTQMQWLCKYTLSHCNP